MTTTAMQNRKDDYEQLKRTLIADYAAYIGFELDKADSGQKSKVMRRGGDKIIVYPETNTFAGREPKSGGDIFNLVMTRTEHTAWKQVFQALRAYNGIPEADRNRNSNVVALRAFDAKPKAKPIENFREAWAQLYTYSVEKSRYLQSRAIPDRIIGQFKQFIRLDQALHNNVCFIHTDAEGEPTGWEVKNRRASGESWTSFSTGGKKLLWRAESRLHGRRELIVIAESAIDAMSYAALNLSEHGAAKPGLYLSTAGEFGPDAREELRKLLAANPDAEIISAFDDDSSGKRFTAQIREMVPGREVIRAVPALGKDFNEELQTRVEFGEVIGAPLELA